MVLCLIPVTVLVMLPDLLRSLQYLHPFLLQKCKPLSFLVVPWYVVLGMSPVECDPEAVASAGLLVKGTGVMLGLTNSSIDLCRGCCLAATPVVGIGGSGGAGAT